MASLLRAGFGDTLGPSVGPAALECLHNDFCRQRGFSRLEQSEQIGPQVYSGLVWGDAAMRVAQLMGVTPLAKRMKLPQERLQAPVHDNGRFETHRATRLRVWTDRWKVSKWFWFCAWPAIFLAGKWKKICVILLRIVDFLLFLNSFSISAWLAPALSPHHTTPHHTMISPSLLGWVAWLCAYAFILIGVHAGHSCSLD